MRADQENVPSVDRRKFMGDLAKATALTTTALASPGCWRSVPLGSGLVESTWGARGDRKGLFQKPRAVTIDSRDRLYIVDMSGRVQVFDRDGEFLRSWHTPTIENGKPSGMEMSSDDLVMVADTHYFQVLFYTQEGEAVPDRTIGGLSGNGPGAFNFVTDVVQDSRENYYVSEYGEVDRIQKIGPDGQFAYQWGSQGGGDDQFQRPNSLAMGPNDHLWVADACNHRIKVYDVGQSVPKLVKIFGQHGDELGELRYPYDLIVTPDENLIVVEFGNHRVQRLTLDGQPIASFGTAGREEGQFTQPWGAALDSTGRLHVLDSYNHRVQRIRI
jgi:sugar lactone lactonase YvrE